MHNSIVKNICQRNGLPVVLGLPSLEESDNSTIVKIIPESTPTRVTTFLCLVLVGYVLGMQFM